MTWPVPTCQISGLHTDTRRSLMSCRPYSVLFRLVSVNSSQTMRNSPVMCPCYHQVQINCTFVVFQESSAPLAYHCGINQTMSLMDLIGALKRITYCILLTTLVVWIWFLITGLLHIHWALVCVCINVCVSFSPPLSLSVCVCVCVYMCVCSHHHQLYYMISCVLTGQD